MPPSSSSGLRSPASRALFTLAIVGSAFALGGLHTPVLCVTTALLAAAAFLGWYNGSPLRPRLPATILLVAGVALTAFTALQAVPLPAPLVRLIAPATADVWSRALEPLHESGPTWITLSLDPTATRIQVLRGVAYLCSFLVALRICERGGGSRFLSTVIALSALALAFAAALHPMFGAQRVFGLYQPHEHIDDRHIAPLLNPNHLAGYLNVGFCLALGMAIDRRAERHRPIAIAIALFLATTQLWIASRGGMLALVFGATCTFLMARVSRRFALRTTAPYLVPGAIVVAGLAMAILGASPESAGELNSTDVSKLTLAKDGLRLVTHHAFFGVGRGAYEVAFPAVRSDLGYSVVTHPENLLVQWLTEWGVPVAVAGFGAIAIALRPRVLVVSSSPAIGAWSAIVTTVLHNLVDFNSEVPAVGIAVAACAAMVVAGQGTVRTGRIHKWGTHPNAVAIAALASAVAFIGGALLGWPHELDADRDALYRGAIAPELRDDFADVTRAALVRHPSEPYIPFIAAVEASRRGRSVLPWVERTLTLAPIYAPAHFALAQQLATISPAQARLEYRLSIAQGFSGSTRALQQGADLVNDYEDALELLPDRYPLRARILAHLSGLLSYRLPSTSERLDEMERKFDANARDILLRSVRDTLADIEAGNAAPWCDHEYTCVQQGLSVVARLQAMDPGSCSPLVSKARLLIAADRAADGLHELREGAQSATDPAECWRQLGELALGANNDVYMQVAEDEVGRSGCDVEADCANNLLWIASLEQRRGNPRKAVGILARAHEKAPDRADILQNLGNLAAGLGLHGQALDAFRQLQTMGPDPKWQAAADREKTALFHEQAPP